MQQVPNRQTGLNTQSTTHSFKEETKCSSPCCTLAAAMKLLPGDIAKRLEEMVLLTAQNLPQVEIAKSYTILRELGSGSFGHVLMAVHQGQGTPMALKFVHKKNTELQDFLSEYCIALTLGAHPCIATALGIAFQTPHHYVFAQELALARDLFSLMVPQVGVPEQRVKRCALQLSSALEYMETKGLVHRDVKPENVLLCDPECRRIKLTDFGLSCPRGQAIEALPESLPYTAPELCVLGPKAHLEAQPSLDTWALGVLLFCVLTGYFPWLTAVPADRYYRSFVCWHRSPCFAPRPPHWDRFTPHALEMLKGLLMPDPDRRTPAKEVMNFIKLPWMVPGAQSHTRPSKELLGTSRRC
ncbi:serine/threonine-protein kinase SBK2-like [Varanus komodoensis]|uniref:Protein kinase domain-containing protein n=1 Tax=Varanus komodoensis TaxID=61221 RepID=A0A8D2J1V5_VARKO|nr:serine/threonine-protein kinase SBK2-like [Varanus komodoensis]